jgi:hypothetical protein
MEVCLEYERQGQRARKIHLSNSAKMFCMTRNMYLTNLTENTL